MDVFVLRHGRAAPISGSDADRPLTAYGKTQLHHIGRAICAMRIHPDILATSPLRRATQTAQIISEYVNVKYNTWDSLVPGTPPSRTISDMDGYHRIMLVGHEPHLSELISHIISQGAASISLKKGGLAHIRDGSLRYLLTPKQMVLMS